MYIALTPCPPIAYVRTCNHPRQEYFNTEGFQRWNRIYSDTAEVNKVQADIRCVKLEWNGKEGRNGESIGAWQGVLLVRHPAWNQHPLLLLTEPNRSNMMTCT